MFKKILLSVVMIGISFVTGYATAQSFFLNNSSSPATNENQQPKNVLSPNDFQSQIEQLQEKKNQALKDQLSQSLSKVPPTPPPTTAVPESAPAMPESGTPEASQMGPSPPGANQPAAANPSTIQPPQEAPSGPSPAAPPISAPSQTQVYTGFQNQEQSSSPGTNQSQPPSSGGWNIKY